MHSDHRNSAPAAPLSQHQRIGVRIRNRVNVFVQHCIQGAAQDLRFSLIMLIGFFIGLTIAPFTVYRFFSGQFFHGLVNLFIVSSIISLTFYAYATGNSLRAGKILVGIVGVAGSITAVFLGWEGFVWLYPGIIASMFISTPVFGFTVSMVMIAVVFTASDHFDSGIQTVSSLATYIITGLITLLVSWRYSVEHDFLEHRAEHDPLTGLKNRYSMEGVIESAVHQATQASTPASILMLDIDHFKTINDELGHQAGDHVLQRVGALLHNGCRSQDSVCRYGGEEFVIVLNNCIESDAMAVAEKLRRRVDEQVHYEDFPITVSIGVTQLQPHDKPRTALERADASMYSAKTQGRNRCQRWFDEANPCAVATGSA